MEEEWREIALEAGELVDEIAAVVAATVSEAAAGVHVRGSEVVLWAPLSAAPALERAMRDAAGRMAAEGLPVDPAAVAVRPAPPEAEWRDAWKRHFGVTRITRRLVIVPSWESFTPGAGDLVLHLDPGRAFGTGAHATTRLCLAELERLAGEGLPVRRFLDVGTGSGILAIAAAQLWPEATGVATDVDPQATDAARENLERNGVLGRVLANEDPPSAVPGRFEVVVANIQADILDELADEIAAKVAPGGALVLSGILTWQVEGVVQRYERAGLRVERTGAVTGPEEAARGLCVMDDRDWSAIVMRAP